MAEIVLTSSVLILVTVAVRYLLRGKFPLRLQYGLWALTALRLLVPVTFAASSLSVLNAVPAAGGMDSLYISPQREIITQASGEREPVTVYDYRPVQFGPASNDGTLSYVDSYDVLHQVEYEHQIDLTAVTAALRPVWYAGMAAMGLWFLWVDLSFRRRLKATARRVEAADCPLPVFVAEGIASPCLFGLFRPAIYVTPPCLEDEARLRHVLAHELTHWRHKDHLWSLVRCLCLTVYWFDPLVWLAASLSRRDCELACDEGALARLGEEERTAYGRTLIGLMAVSSSPARLLQTATTMVDGKRGIKERLTLIAQKPKVLAAAAVAAVLIAAVAAACTFTGADTPDVPDAPDPSASPSGTQLEQDPPPTAYATVEEALADIPTDTVLAAITAYGPEGGPQFFDLEGGEIFRAYWTVYLYLSSNLEDPLGWMGSVYRLDQEAYDALASSTAEEGTYWSCFAADDRWYYAIHAPITAPELRAGLTEGEQLQDSLISWLCSAVCAVQGVTEFNGWYRTPNASYFGHGHSTYEIRGRDALRMYWSCPSSVIPNGQLYFAAPTFLGPFFQDNIVEGGAALEDDAIHVDFTVDTDNGSGVVDGPYVGFRVDADGIIVDRVFIGWEEGSIPLSDEEMVQIAQTLRDIIHDVEVYTENRGLERRST